MDRPNSASAAVSTTTGITSAKSGNRNNPNMSSSMNPNNNGNKESTNNNHNNGGNAPTEITSNNSSANTPSNSSTPLSTTKNASIPASNGVFTFSSVNSENISAAVNSPLRHRTKSGDSGRKRNGVKSRAFYVGVESSSAARRHRKTVSLGTGLDNPWQMPDNKLETLRLRLEEINFRNSIRSIDEAPGGEASTVKQRNHSRNLSEPLTASNRNPYSAIRQLRRAAMRKRALHRRQKILEFQRLKLKNANQTVTASVQLKKHVDTIRSLTLKAKYEIEMESASIRRAIMLSNAKVDDDRNVQKLDRIFNAISGLKRSKSEGQALGNVLNEEAALQETDGDGYIFSVPGSNASSPTTKSKATLQIETANGGSAYPTSASSPSPTAKSPAALELKKRVQGGGSSDKSSPEYDLPDLSPIMMGVADSPEERGQPPPVIHTRKAAASISSQTGMSSGARKQLLDKLHNRLRRSNSAPSPLITIKSLIMQLQVGALIRAPLKITDMLPPINHYTLRELDFDEIINNVQLRHDLVFDPNLQFKPNDEGEKGTERERKTTAFWNRVSEDMQKVMNSSNKGEKSAFKGSNERTMEDYLQRPFFLTVPILINEIKEIMLEILPYSSAFHDELNDRFDVDHFSRQMENNTLDPVPLIEYIGRTLKTHCAPIRDEAVDKMVETCKKGDFVTTLRNCFSILELMKLDIANHQLRRIRPHVIEHAIEFESTYFMERLKQGLVTQDKTKSWLTKTIADPDPFGISKTLKNSLVKSASSMNVVKGPLSNVIGGGIVRSSSLPFLNDTTQESGGTSINSIAGTPKNSSTNSLAATLGSHTDIYYKALLSLISNFKDGEAPETFSLDLTRLTGFHNDWQDMTILSCLLVVYRQSVGPKGNFNDTKTMKEHLWILLNDSETTLPHVNLHILGSAEKTRGTPFSEAEKSTLTALIDKTLSPDSALYGLVQSRIGIQIYLFLQTGALNKELLGKHGLSELETEIETLAQKIKPFAEHNRLAYASIYNDIVREATQIPEQ